MNAQKIKSITLLTFMLLFIAASAYWVLTHMDTFKLISDSILKYSYIPSFVIFLGAMYGLLRNVDIFVKVSYPLSAFMVLYYIANIGSLEKMLQQGVNIVIISAMLVSLPFLFLNVKVLKQL